MGEEEIPSFVLNASLEAKLQELLHYITSTEIKLCADGAKEFVKLLKGSRGGELLRLYLRTSPKCPELLETWKLRQGKPGISYILSLISALLDHPDGRYVQGDRTRIAHCRVLDDFARLLVDEKLEDVYGELNSKEAKRQKAALQLMASIVRRISDLATEVAKKFDFTLPAFRKLGEYRKKKRVDDKRKHSTRKPFVGFAMSFLEVGRPGLLRWILQQKDMYSGVLRGLENDDDETLIFILSTLRDRVLTAESLVPPGLRSVLFGSVTLEQLVSISGRENGGLASELAHSILVMVCTHPSNGLMPDLKRSTNQLKGNPKRLLGLMKKLRAAEIGYHRDLLLAIVHGKPSFGSAYMEEFPYNIEDHASPNWFSAVSLAADVVSAVGMGSPFVFLDSISYHPPPFDGPDVQNVIKSVCPRPFTRSNMNKGLLHTDILVKNATLRLLLEELRLLDSFICSLDIRSRNLPSWEAFKREIQNEARTVLPDPQVLLSLLSSLSSTLKSNGSHVKRKASSEDSDSLVQNSYSVKKRKVGNSGEDADIIVGGIASDIDVNLPDENEEIADLGEDMDDSKNLAHLYAEIWGSDQSQIPVSTTRDAEIYFCTKLFEALQIYLRIMPSVLEGSFDFFVNLLSNSPNLPMNLLSSVLGLLVEYIRWPPGSVIPLRTPALMYKHLQTLINLSLFSPLSSIRAQAYRLSVAAMLSTGAFDKNPHEVDAWSLFLPNYIGNTVQEIEVLQSFSSAVISFLCDAVSTIGKNLFKFWDLVRCNARKLKDSKDYALNFSPLAICILQKCLRVIKSESGSFPLSEKTVISIYVSSTLKYLLQTQVDPSMLSAAILSLMSDTIGECPNEDDLSGDFLCEWRPLKSLFVFARGTFNHQSHCHFASDPEDLPADNSFSMTLSQTKELLRRSNTAEISAIIKAFSSSIICTSPAQILQNFPSIMTVSKNLHGVTVWLLSSLFFVNGSLLARVSKLWPELFSAALEMVASRIDCKGQKDDALNMYGDSFGSELPATAFSLFLEEGPFHVLFLVVMSSNGLILSGSSDFEILLLDKLSESTVECLISYVRLVLFWVHQIQLSYRDLPSAEVKRFSESCVGLLKSILAQLFSSKRFLQSPQLMQEAAEGMFYHPAVTAFLSPTWLSSERFTKQYMADPSDAFSSLSENSTEETDFHVLGVLETASYFLWSLVSGQNIVTESEKGGLQHLANAFNSLIQRLLAEVRKRFELCVEMKSVITLLPVYRALLALVRLISPLQLLAFVRWIFDRINIDDVSITETFGKTLLSIGCHVASCAFDTVDIYLQQPIAKRAQFDIFWKAGEWNFDINIIGEIYLNVLKQAQLFQADFADLCLLKAISAVYRQKSAQYLNLHPLSFVLLRVVGGTPLEMLSYCINRISVTRAKILFMIVELNPLQLSIFGHIFSNILLPEDNLTKKNQSCSLSIEDLLMLLPSALSFLKSTVLRYGKECCSTFSNIPLVYSRILLDGFRQWKSFVSGFSFQEEYAEFFPSSMEELLKIAEGSFLGKAVCMLRYHFLLNGGSVKLKKCLKLFNSILPESASHNELLDCDIEELSSCSTKELLNVISRVFAKISLCQMLLFPECDISEDVKSDGLFSSRTRLIRLLVYTWQQIVKKLPLGSDNSAKGKGTESSSLYNYLEAFVLRSIHVLTTKMRDDLIQLQSIPFLEELIRSILLFRFEDPKSLKTLRSILTILWDGQFSCFPYLQLLLAHSQFPHTLHSISKTSESLQLGAFLRPMSSILRTINIPAMNHSDREKDKEMADQCIRKLEVLKLLRTLLHFTGCDHGQSAKEDGINFQELLMLLLSSYNATLDEIDQEIYSLVQDIEFTYGDKANLAETDFLWGSSALKIRKERALEQNILTDVVNDAGALEQRRRSQVRENLPINPTLCAATVLDFPYDRVAVTGPSPLETIDTNEINNMPEIHTCGAKRIRRYDPVFIMRFSLHMLSVGFIEPVEFASLGLVAVAFCCLSSPDDGMRKLAYEALARLKNALETCQKKKAVIRLRLLLTNVQNGIQEPWQRLPSVITLFAAEASFVLLDPSHDHYAALSKILTRSAKINMKSVPLFPDFLWSTAVNFKSERLWILRLIYAGLNSDDDATIFTRNSIFENLLSFYSTPVSDYESRELILQIVKKSVKLPKLARYLAEQCGLFSWLSSVLSFATNNLSGDDRSFCSRQLIAVLEVAYDLTLSRNITEWLQKYALEQLSELSSHLLKLLHGNVKLSGGGGSVVDLILQIMISTLKISQKRKLYQPHFTLAMEGLYKVYEVVSLYDSTGSHLTSEYGLNVMLMSTPQPILNMDPEKLSKFVTWAITVALKSDNAQMLQSRFARAHLALFSPEEETSEEPMMSKLLRWITASVILGHLCQRSLYTDAVVSTRLSLRTLEVVLESIKGSHRRESNGSSPGREEFLIDAMLYFLQLLGTNCRVLPSVVSALCMLLLNSSEATGADSEFFLHGISGSSVLSRIRCPAEANPTWRWSFYQPWKDLTSERTALEEMDEYHACQTLLVAVSNFRGRKLPGSQVLSPLDVEKSGVFEWERSLIAEQMDGVHVES
ncbi:uncharacterized protein LOC116192162 isoform X1 [Punica granatum]|uniref:Uncharacterized protein LOC116192162 isoform X1 n=2 Tax=Punica granatum TaxID=22663 RepID=A0A6P8BZD2_PUNGR|nr:uncharacterized protein LOC116192162 isoform X1 [Punica granatum]PKI67693.1 hypothetical protein CRG98_011906 [Punica granatum]